MITLLYNYIFLSDLCEIAKPCRSYWDIMEYRFLMESAGPGGILFMCLHFVHWMQMNAFLAFQNLLGLANMGLNVCT